MSAFPPRVYYTCSYVPPEAIWAAGCQPVRLLPDGPAPGECDAYLPRDFCPFVRAAFWQLHRMGEPAAVVLTTCCDPMRRLADVLRHHRPELTVLLLDLPRERGPRGQERYAAELERLQSSLSAWAARSGRTGLAPGSGRTLAQATGTFDRLRHLLRAARGAMPAPAFHRLLRHLLTCHPEEALTLLETGRGIAAPGAPAATEAAAPGSTEAGGATAGAPGVMVITSHPVDPHALGVIEKAGARVVAEDSCLGERLLAVAPGSRDAGELARAYLERPPCPRMELPGERLAYLEDLACRGGARGIIFLALKFCDNLSYDLPWISGRSLPVLLLEADWGVSSSGQFLTRVQAFVETLLPE